MGHAQVHHWGWTAYAVLKRLIHQTHSFGLPIAVALPRYEDQVEREGAG